ncbi:MAG: FKBP-type peptidyl-prolyl cis-trans isomerase [Lachnospiraceae bacterium]|nr:FKBP-type peptidyl-prolyl cis-trans isomerase [Lachnospiraceae bacterium]
MSNTKDKKLRRKRAEKKARWKKSLATLFGVLLGLVVIGAIGWLIFYNVSFSVKDHKNYSIGLNADGTIEGIKAKDYVMLPGYQEITVQRSELEISDEEVDEYIESLLADEQTLNTDESLVVKEGDSINLDYVGSIDGVEFDGGSTMGMGASIVVGQANYIEGFESQLVGHHVGESFDIEVTFPEDYGNEELNGKDAVFAITLNGIYEDAVFDDDFVKEHFSNEASTAKEYIQNYKDSKFEENLTTYVQNYLLDNSRILDYPESYVKGLMGLLKGIDIDQYNAYNNYYKSTMGSETYKSLQEYTGLDKKEYYASLRTQAENNADANLIYQAVYEDANLTVTEEHKNLVLQSYGVTEQYYQNLVDTYGEGFLNQAAIRFAVLDYVKGLVTIE